VDAHLDVEVGGSDEDWTARVIETDTAAKEFGEVAVVKVSGGSAWVFEERKSLPLTVL
jgi:leucyl aminopeptidase (aminopeptidase T)